MEAKSLDELEYDNYKIDYVTIVLDDETKFQNINKKYLEVCLVLKNMMIVHKYANIIPVHSIDNKTFNYILEFINKKEGIDKIQIINPLKSISLKENIIDLDKVWLSNWIENIINKEGITQIYKLINASNTLNIQGLLKLCCAIIAIEIAKDPSKTDIFNMK